MSKAKHTKSKKESIPDIKTRLRLKLAETSKKNKICLTMIVKNESKNMPRLLQSLHTIIDMISIVDTGSTDNTIDVIHQEAKKYNIPCTVHKELFKNFSYNRTHSIRTAKKTYPEATYFLLSDADFVWDVNVGTAFNKNLLIDHVYNVKQYTNSLHYMNVRMLSAEVDFECIGVTHEYWSPSKNQSKYQGNVRYATINTLCIDDREDGGCKEDKFERDERLLKHELDNPDGIDRGLLTRYKFYLAQTYRDMGRYLDSMEMYQKRVDDQGWQEEVYFSIYQIGKCSQSYSLVLKKYIESLEKPENERTDEDKMILTSKSVHHGATVEEYTKEMNLYNERAKEKYLEAYNYRPTRLESLYWLVVMLKDERDHQKAYDYAILGLEKPTPNDVLFIETPCYDFRFMFELSIICYYLPDKKEEGALYIELLLNKSNLPSNYMDIVKRNAQFYL